MYICMVLIYVFILVDVSMIDVYMLMELIESHYSYIFLSIGLFSLSTTETASFWHGPSAQRLCFYPTLRESLAADYLVGNTINLSIDTFFVYKLLRSIAFTIQNPIPFRFWR